MNLFPYLETKNPGLPWLDKVPNHWNIKRAKQVFRCIDIRSKTGSEELLTVSAVDGVRKRSSKAVTMFMAESYAGHKLCWQGDLVVNSLWAWATGLGFSQYHGIISTAYSVYRPQPEYAENWEYFHHLFRSRTYDWEFTVRSKGIWISRLQMTDESFMQMPVLIPPPEEQEAIARFIRHIDQRVNRLIRAKRRLIELLTEQKQALIHQAVTRGLDPNARLKPSGVEWLGEIPEGWTVKPLKHWATINATALSEKTSADFAFRYLDIGTVGTGKLVREPERILFSNAPSRARRIVRIGDTLLSTVRTYLKAVYFIEDASEPLIASTGFAILSPTREIAPRYLSYLIQSADFIDHVTANSTGIAYPAITETKIGTFHLAAPSIGEQGLILEYLDNEMEPFENALVKASTEIELIREYRTRLISDVVTGKLDVRGADLPNMDAEIEWTHDEHSESEEGEEPLDGDAVEESL